MMTITHHHLLVPMLSVLALTLAALPEPSLAGRFGKIGPVKPPVSTPAPAPRITPHFNRSSGAASAHYINKTPTARDRLRARLEQEARAGRGAGSIGRTQRRTDGTRHETAYNRGAGVHYSRDVAADGTVSKRHWTDHATGRRIGDRD